MIKINDTLFLHENELVETFIRASGPGGQNVNKVNTRVTLRFDVGACASLDDGQRRRIRRRLATRITREDVLLVVSSRHRTQSGNRRAVIERFVELLAGELKRSKPRKKTTVSRGAKNRHVQDKRRRSKVKRLRSGSVEH